MRTALTVISVSMLVACGGSVPEAEEPSGSSYEGAIGSTDVDGGKALFELHCDDCHPGGEEDVGPSLIAEPHSAARIRQQIREGSGRMRPFSDKRVSDDEVEAILAYLQSLGAVQ